MSHSIMHHQEEPSEDIHSNSFVAGNLLLDVDYAFEGNVMAIPENHSPGVTEEYSETLIQLSSADFEIDISPDVTSELKTLRSENEDLKDKVTQLKVEMEKIKADASHKTPSMLFMQLTAGRKRVEELEKRCSDLETENMELHLRLERKESHRATPVETEATGQSNPYQIQRSISTAQPRRAAMELKGPDIETVKLAHAKEIARLEAEHSLEKEEILNGHREALEELFSQVEQMKIETDKLECRFETKLSNYEDKMVETIEFLMKIQQEALKAKADVDKRQAELQTDVTRILRIYPNEIRKLSSKIRTQTDVTADELEKKERDLEEAKRQIDAMSEEATRQTELISELELQIASMKTERLVPTSGVQGDEIASIEMAAMRSRIEELEGDLESLKLSNEAFMKEKDELTEQLRSIKTAEDDNSYEELEKENEELELELMEVSERLAALEDHNDELKMQIENQQDYFGQCLDLKEELQAQLRVNKSLEEHLSRRKRRIDSLQAEMGNLRQQLGDLERGFGVRRKIKETKAALSNQVKTIMEMEQRYEDLERILSGVQDERDELLQEKASLHKIMHSLVKENKATSQALKKLKEELPIVKEDLQNSRIESTKLQARLKAETFARQYSGRSNVSCNEIEEDIISKLVASQVELAEMDERMIKLRKELHKSVARNMYLASKTTRLEKQLRRDQ